MLGSFFRGVKRVALLGIGFALLLSLAGSAGQVAGAVVAWLVLAYLVVRALPAIRGDVQRLASLRRALPAGRYLAGRRSFGREDGTL